MKEKNKKKDERIKTHWLQNPNKNYFGHQDLPNGQDVVLQIKSAKWEKVKNHITNTSEEKRVIRWHEDCKPFIVNETNAQMILKSTDTLFMEDAVNKYLQIGLGQTKVAGEMVSCLRVRNKKQHQLKPDYINDSEITQIRELIENSPKSIEEICQVMKIESINKLPKFKYKKLCARLEELIRNENN